MARRPHDDGDISALSEAWVRETVDGRVRYTNCVTGATQNEVPPAHEIVMKPSDYNREMRSYQKNNKSFSFFKRPRAGLRAPCIGVCFVAVFALLLVPLLHALLLLLSLLCVDAHARHIAQEIFCLNSKMRKCHQ